LESGIITEMLNSAAGTISWIWFCCKHQCTLNRTAIYPNRTVPTLIALTIIWLGYLVEGRACIPVGLIFYQNQFQETEFWKFLGSMSKTPIIMFWICSMLQLHTCHSFEILQGHYDMLWFFFLISSCSKFLVMPLYIRVAMHVYDDHRHISLMGWVVYSLLVTESMQSSKSWGKNCPMISNSLTEQPAYTD